MTTLKALDEALTSFSKFTGMEVNRDKSGVVFSKFVTRMEELLELVNFPQLEFPIKYFCICDYP